MPFSSCALVEEIADAKCCSLSHQLQQGTGRLRTQVLKWADVSHLRDEKVQSIFVFLQGLVLRVVTFTHFQGFHVQCCRGWRQRLNLSSAEPNQFGEVSF